MENLDDNKLGDSIQHCLNRGVLKINIFNNKSDWWRFLEILRYKNHAFSRKRWHSTINSLVSGTRMPWPQDEWGKQEPLVNVSAYILMDNHYHLILEEVSDGGISEFVRKLANSYISYLRYKYDRDKRLFKGDYTSKEVRSDNQLRKLFVYVLVKNAFERYPDGLRAAINDFDNAYRQAVQYQFSALGGLINDRRDDVVSPKLFSHLFRSPQEFKAFARDQMNRYGAFLSEIDNITLE